MFKYTTLESFLTPSECEEILNYSLKNLYLSRGKVFAEKHLTQEIRKSSVAFLDCNIIFPKIVEKLEKQLINRIKVKGYEVDFENVRYQFTEYKTGEFYEWHTDSDDLLNNRYCSIVLQLTDEYTGGELELIDEKEIVKFKNGKGNLFIFLSKLKHRVTKIESGNRYSLVTWFKLKPIQNYSKSLI
jgi:hypothetical protein